MASGDTCVLVVGMHRSGTSATAGVLSQLGLGAPSGDDLTPATRRNALGHFESKRLTGFNDQLLERLGGSWSAPPPVEPEWRTAEELGPARLEAAALLASTFPDSPFVWKDPRNCVVLPFWTSVIRPPVAAVFVYRDPVAVARSLRTRNGFGLTHGLALWERYVRAAVTSLDGVPTLAAEYNRILGDPSAWCAELAHFLAEVGVVVEAGRYDDAFASLDAGLRHEDDSGPCSVVPSSSARDVLRALSDLQGAHLPWRAPRLEPEPEWVGDVLAMRLEFEHARRENVWLRRSRAVRLAARLSRLRAALARRPPRAS
jgi:hypothetical protein